MKRNPQGPSEDHSLDQISAVGSGPPNPPAGVLSASQLTSFLVQITREVWRLGSAVERCRTRGEPVSDEIAATLERLQEELQSLGLEASDPVGQTYDPGMRVEIGHLEPGGSGDLVIKRTVLPGVVLNGAMLKPASVVVGRIDSP